MKMYVIVRKDLSNSQQAVQAGHALSEFLLYGKNTKWDNGTLIYLGVRGLWELEKLKMKLKMRNVPHSEFYEPDIGNQLTALATDENCSFFKRLNLM